MAHPLRITGIGCRLPAEKPSVLHAVQKIEVSIGDRPLTSTNHVFIPSGFPLTFSYKTGLGNSE